MSFSLISCCSSPALFTLFIKMFLEWFSVGEEERNQLKSGEATSFFWEMKQMKAVHLEIFQSLVLKPGYYLHHLLYAPAKWIRAFPSGTSLRITSLFLNFSTYKKRQQLCLHHSSIRITYICRERKQNMPTKVLTLWSKYYFELKAIENQW